MLPKVRERRPLPPFVHDLALSLNIQGPLFQLRICRLITVHEIDQPVAIDHHRRLRGSSIPEGKGRLVSTPPGGMKGS